MERYQRKAYAVAYGMVRNADDAMDVTQDAFIKVHRYLDRFQGSSGFYTWLYRIVVNLALDRRRRAKRVPQVEWDDGVAHELDPRSVVPSGADPEVASRRAEVQALVAEGVQQLPDGQREVLLLREVEGLSYEEISESLECSIGTVKSRLARAHGALSKNLDRVLEHHYF